MKKEKFSIYMYPEEDKELKQKKELLLENPEQKEKLIRTFFYDYLITTKKMKRIVERGKEMKPREDPEIEKNRLEKKILEKEKEPQREDEWEMER